MVRCKIVILLTYLVAPFALYAQKDDALILKGNEHYKKGEFDKAAEAYSKAAEANKKNAKAQYNLGNALYKKNQPDAAAKAFEAVSEATDDKGLLSRSAYNKGVMHSRQNQLMESIMAYKHALKTNPQDQQARENLQRALNELKKQPPPKNQDNKNQQNNKDQNKEQQRPERKSSLNEQQAERLLNALRQEEKRLQQNKQEKQQSGNRPEKDW